MKDRTVYVIQLITLSFNWMLAASVTWWFVHLVTVANELHDTQTASLWISVLAITVFWILAGVLSYVFFSLHRKVEEEA
jgi:hypothetical protein